MPPKANLPRRGRGRPPARHRSGDPAHLGPAVRHRAHRAHAPGTAPALLRRRPGPPGADAARPAARGHAGRGGALRHAPRPRCRRRPITRRPPRPGQTRGPDRARRRPADGARDRARRQARTSTRPAGAVRGRRCCGCPVPDRGARGLGRAALALDSTAVRDLVAERVDRGRGRGRTWDDVVRPVLVAVAQRWEHSGAGVEIEHLLSECVTAVFGARARRRSRPPRTPGRCCSPACRASSTSLPLVVLAAALAEQRRPLPVAGRDLPVDARWPRPSAGPRRRRSCCGRSSADRRRRRARVACPSPAPASAPSSPGPAGSARELPPRVVRLGSLVGRAARDRQRGSV